MPTYSYRCADCDHAFDIHQAFTDDNLTICPNCGGKLRKIFSPVGVSFSGSGFYRNDSRAEAKSGSGSGAKSEGKSDSGTSESGKSGSGKSDSGAKSDSASSSKSESSASPAKSDSTPKKDSKPAASKS